MRLGYDKYEDLKTEYQVKGEFADYGVRIAKQLVAFIEVKRCTTKLGAKHLRQVEMYAVNEGVEWMILTNGQVWQAWHLTPGMPVELDMALEVDLLGEGGPTQKADILFHLSKEAFKRHVIDDLWRVKAATSARSLGLVITSDSVIDQIRKELRRQTGHNMDADDLCDFSNPASSGQRHSSPTIIRQIAGAASGAVCAGSNPAGHHCVRTKTACKSACPSANRFG
jgi:hypothetical protein